MSGQLRRAEVPCLETQDLCQSLKSGDEPPHFVQTYLGTPPNLNHWTYPQIQSPHLWPLLAEKKCFSPKLSPPPHYLLPHHLHAGKIELWYIIHFCNINNYPNKIVRRNVPLHSKWKSTSCPNISSSTFLFGTNFVKVHIIIVIYFSHLVSCINFCSFF